MGSVLRVLEAPVFGCDDFAARPGGLGPVRFFFADFEIEILRWFVAASAAPPKPRLGAWADGAGSQDAH